MVSPGLGRRRVLVVKSVFNEPTTRIVLGIGAIFLKALDGVFEFSVDYVVVG